MSVQITEVVDSHTAGEPTRVVLRGGPHLGSGSLAEQSEIFRREFDDQRLRILAEPRGSDVLVGALLLPPEQPGSVASTIFFNDAGYLGMCGHGTIGLVKTLEHLGRIGPGIHAIDTPVGTVATCLHDDGSVTVRNVPSYRHRQSVTVDVPGFGEFVGDVAWGGNWFFLVSNPACVISADNTRALMDLTMAIRNALRARGITGEHGADIDHVELFAAAGNPENAARNFVLCPGAAFDRSPCGTGTSAKMACLFADGKLKEGEVWRQEGILGTVFEGSVEGAELGLVVPSIRGKAWITGETKLIFASDDPFAGGFRF